MEYIVSLSSQTKNFFFSLGFGALIGVLYDILRVIRITVSQSKNALYITDFIFVFVSSIATFMFCLTVTDGQLRFYIILGEALGFIIYYFSFGIIAVQFSARTVLRIKKTLKKIFKFVFSPFIKIFSIITKFLKKNAEKSRKSVKKLTKNIKILLQTNKPLLYNQGVKKQKIHSNSRRMKVTNTNENEEEKKEYP